MNKLKRIREAAGMSQSQLAEKTGVKLQAIQHYEQGYRDLSGAKAITVYRIAEALNCTIKDLIL